MSEETKPAETAKTKLEIPTQAIRKISDKQFSVFVEEHGQWRFLSFAESRGQAETVYSARVKK